MNKERISRGKIVLVNLIVQDLIFWIPESKSSYDLHRFAFMVE